jgi:hypothetical protein
MGQGRYNKSGIAIDKNKPVVIYRKIQEDFSRREFVSPTQLYSELEGGQG